MTDTRDKLISDAIDRCYAGVKLYCLAMLGSAEKADAAARTVFERAYREKSVPDGEEWYMKAAQEAAHAMLGGAFSARHAADSMDRLIDESVRTKSLISTLPEKDRDVYERVYRGGMTVKEAARSLGISVIAVRKSIMRIKRALSLGEGKNETIEIN